MAIMMLSQGIPMLLAGDEVLRTQKGNNNCYCQDNELGWFDWGLVEKNADVLRFVQEMIAFRMRHTCLRRTHFLTGTRKNSRGVLDIVWHGLESGSRPWDDPESRFIAFTMGGIEAQEPDIHVICNMEESVARANLPEDAVFNWHLAVDTMKHSPDDIITPQEQKPWKGTRYTAGPRSVVVFESRP